MSKKNKFKSDLVKVKKSSIHNRGVFAKTDIEEDTFVIEYVGERITKKESDRIADKVLKKSQKNPKKGAVYIFNVNKKYDIDGDVDYNPAKYINHSCEPNCEAVNVEDHIWITAKRDIKKGEEISYNYGYDTDSYEDHRCLCGSKKCLGYIVAKEYRKKLKKILRKKKKESKKRNRE